MPQTKFAHMLPAEASLWSAFLKKYPTFCTDLMYDVHVGDGVSVGPEYDIMTQGVARSLTQKRIDAVGFRFGVPWIFEVKLQAAINAFGQVMAYRELYRKTYRHEGPIELAIVTDRVLEDDRWVYEKHGIHLFLVEAVGV